MQSLLNGLEIIWKKCPESEVEAECGYIRIDLMNQELDQYSINLLVDRLGWVPYCDGFKYYL